MPQLIPLLATKPLAEILEEPFVAPLLPPLLERHRQSIGILAGAHRVQGRHHLLRRYRSGSRGLQQVRSLLSASRVYLQRGLSKSSFRVKVSVGSNPWAPEEPTVNLAKICERYGGGGHARVGAISFDVTKHDAARRAAFEIVEELRASVRGAAG